MLSELTKKYGLELYREDIEAVAVKCYEGIAVKGDISSGDSKVGGNPDTPIDFKWPVFKDIPLEFIAQIDCKSVKTDILPERGTICFFYDNRHWGGSIKDKGYISVNYVPEGTEIINRSPPKKERKILWGILGSYVLPKVYKETKIEFREAVSIPDMEALPTDLLKKINSDEALSEAYYEIKTDLTESRFIQIGGYPNPVQYDGIAAGIAKLTGRGSPDHWKMIFEIYCHPLTDMMWGDAGRLHFFTHVEDIKNCNFKDSWMEFQCA